MPLQPIREGRPAPKVLTDLAAASDHADAWAVRRDELIVEARRQGLTFTVIADAALLHRNSVLHIYQRDTQQEA